jgi:hypothetical protein
MNKKLRNISLHMSARKKHQEYSIELAAMSTRKA